MLRALLDGLRAVRRNWGLVAAILLTNVGLALVLAVPLARTLSHDLAHRGASSAMMYGFDYDWWASWSSRQTGYATELGPDLLGSGFAFKSLDLLLQGVLPLGLFDRGRSDLAPVILGVAALYLLLQVFLTGGLIGVFRAWRGGWTVRGLLHGSGFYFGRLFRLSLVSLVLVGVVFALNAPLARFVDDLAKEAVSERTAVALTLGRHLILFIALLLVHMLVSFAKVILVSEERLSALLAVVSSLGFCLRNFLAAAGQYAVVAAAGALLLLVFTALDARLLVVGWKSQLLALVLFEATIAARIAVRLSLLAGQVELLQARRR
jgi:hypothetical protein